MQSRDESLPTGQELANLLAKKAGELGFIAVGFSGPQRPPYFDEFLSWIEDHGNADMAWLERNRDVRADPRRLLAGCETVISLAYAYPSRIPATPDGFIVSRYAHPDVGDYHRVLKEMARPVTHMIRTAFPRSRSRVCVDSAPILERSVACRAGIGFFGKNNMLIIPNHGSYFFLAEILTTALIAPPPAGPAESRCGACTRCIDACPTRALLRPFRLDASRCLSYLTIEKKGPLDKGIKTSMGRSFFGCDRCQEVCPFNSEETAVESVFPSTEEFLAMDEARFRMDFGKTALMRAGLAKLKENILAVRDNSVPSAEF